MIYLNFLLHSLWSTQGVCPQAGFGHLPQAYCGGIVWQWWYPETASANPATITILWAAPDSSAMVCVWEMPPDGSGCGTSVFAGENAVLLIWRPLKP